MKDLLLALALALSVYACDKGKHPAPPSRCEKLYERCQFRDGVIGVCGEAECRPGEPAPCLRCTGQH